MMDPTLLPISDGRRVLRALAASDATRYAEGTEDALVRRFGHLPEPEYSAESVTDLARTVVPAGLTEGNLALLTLADPDDQFLGSVVLFDITSTSAEVGFWLHPDARGAGHGAAAVELAATLAAGSGLNEIRARTVTENRASQGILERTRFQLIAREPGTTPAGHRATLLHYRRGLHAGNAEPA